jgi:hypothetical protein
MDWIKYWKNKSLIERFISWIKVKWGYGRLLKRFDFSIRTSLELGAGKAYLSRILKDRGIETYCIDNDLNSVIENLDYVYKYYLGDMFKCKLPNCELTLSCGVIEHFTIEELKRLKLKSRYILMFYPSCDWRWKLLWKLRKIKLIHYQHSNEDLGKVFGNYKCSFGYVNFFGLHYNYVYGVICQ